MIRFILLMILFLSSAYADDNFAIKKLIPSYEIEDGLYEVKNKKTGRVLYLFKEGRNVILESESEILHSRECRMGKSDDKFIN